MTTVEVSQPPSSYCSQFPCELRREKNWDRSRLKKFSGQTNIYYPQQCMRAWLLHIIANAGYYLTFPFLQVTKICLKAEKILIRNTDFLLEIKGKKYSWASQWARIKTRKLRNSDILLHSMCYISNGMFISYSDAPERKTQTVCNGKKQCLRSKGAQP